MSGQLEGLFVGLAQRRTEMAVPLKPRTPRCRFGTLIGAPLHARRVKATPCRTFVRNFFARRLGNPRGRDVPRPAKKTPNAIVGLVLRVDTCNELRWSARYQEAGQ
jgi:hypothetical protein